MINIGVIGYGHWGANLVRNFAQQPACVVKKVSDLRLERLQLLQTNYPDIAATLQANDILHDPEIDAVVIATPVFTHYEFAYRALLNGKHVLVEKPMTGSYREALTLVDVAGRMGRILMVDHTLLYTGAVQEMKTQVQNGGLGNLQYFDSTRINLGLFQPDVNVLWDLAPHDLSVLNYLIEEEPLSVQATGVSHTWNGIENIAYLTINYASGFIAHLSCSWSSPVRIRQMLIGGDKKMLVFNDLEPVEKVKVYDSGYDHRPDEDNTRILVNYRAGEIYTPQVEVKEPLAGMVAGFLEALLTGQEPLTSGRSGLKTIRILAASQKSIKNKGREVIVQAEEELLV
jgi:predicted dehydrogenase